MLKLFFRDPRELKAEQSVLSQPVLEQMQSSNDLMDHDVILQNPEEETVKTTFFTQFKRLIENYAREVFWTALYTIVLLAIFAERAYCKFTVSHYQIVINSIAFSNIIKHYL